MGLTAADMMDKFDRVYTVQELEKKEWRMIRGQGCRAKRGIGVLRPSFYTRVVEIGFRDQGRNRIQVLTLMDGVNDTQYASDLWV